MIKKIILTLFFFVLSSEASPFQRNIIEISIIKVSLFENVDIPNGGESYKNTLYLRVSNTGIELLSYSSKLNGKYLFFIFVSLSIVSTYLTIRYLKKKKVEPGNRSLKND